MKAHLWLGLLSLPLVLLHSGAHMGGAFSTVLALTFYVVILSGVGGLFLQNVVPRLLWQYVPSETIFGEIDEVARQYASDGARVVLLTCGEAAEAEQRSSSSAVRADAIGQSRGVRPSADSNEPLVARAGAARSVGTEIQPTRSGKREYPFVPLAAALAQAFQRDLEPYLLTGRSSRQQLGSTARDAAYFATLRTLVAAEAWPAIDALAQLCAARRQLDQQRVWHVVLHGWLWLHLPLSAALVVLLVMHVVFALRYG